MDAAQRHAWRRETMFQIGSAVLATHFVLSFITHTTFYIDFNAYVEGTERLPFQYRALMAWLISAGELLPGFGALARRLPEPFTDPRLDLLIILTILATWGAMAALKATVQAQTSSWWIGVCASLALLLGLYFTMILPYSVHQFRYPYDIPQVFFYSLGFLFIITNQKYYLAATIAIGTLNRETTVFLPLIFFLYNWKKESLGPLVFQAAALSIPFVIVKVALHWLYAGNPHESAGRAVLEGLFVNQIATNIENLLGPQYWINFLSLFAFLWLVCVLGWSRISDHGLRRCFWVFVPWFAVMVVAGRITEIRLWIELSPLVAIAVGQVLHSVLQDRAALSALAQTSVPPPGQVHDGRDSSRSNPSPASAAPAEHRSRTRPPA